MKKCSVCQENKSLAEFNRRIDGVKGKQRFCRDCQAIYAARWAAERQRRDPKPGIDVSKKQCSKCHEIKDLIYFHKDKYGTLGVQNSCKTCKKKRTGLSNDSLRRMSIKQKHYRSIGVCITCGKERIPNQVYCLYHKIMSNLKNIRRRAKLPNDISTGHIATALEKMYLAHPYCPYTGEKFELGFNVNLDHKIPIYQRPDLGLDINNLQWVSKKYNMVKGDMTHEELLEFCRKLLKQSIT